MNRSLLILPLILYGCAAGHSSTGAATGDSSLLQRMLVAEDARGLGAEGTAPLLEGQTSSDSTLRFVANRALDRLKWAPSPPPPPRPIDVGSPKRFVVAQVRNGPCSKFEERAQSADLRVTLAVADSIASCEDDGNTMLRLASSSNDNVRASAIDFLSRTSKNSHAYDTVFIVALAAHGYQVVLAGARALGGTPNTQTATTALLAALDRLSAERRENSRDERMMILSRLAEYGSPASAPRIQRYAADYDSTVATKAAQMLTTWTGTAVHATPRPLPIRPEPLAQIFRTRGMQLKITMAPASGGGIILINLFNTEAPATIARVTRLARTHYYDGLSFHRYVANFVIQGGSPGANEQVGDAQFMRDELGGHSHLRGTVGISTRGHDTGDAQFFVNLVDNKRLDHDYTVFGEVISGMDVVDKIRAGDVMARVEVLGGTIQK